MKGPGVVRDAAGEIRGFTRGELDECCFDAFIASLRRPGTTVACKCGQTVHVRYQLTESKRLEVRG